MIITNGTIFTMDKDKIIEKGFIKIENGKIAAVGDMNELKGTTIQDRTIDVNGAFVMPGMIDAHSHLGMWEDALGFEGDDGNEDTDPVTPHLRAIDAINPLDRCFSEALKSGVTTVVTGPGSANCIGGQQVAVKTGGVCIDEMIIKQPVSMKMAFGENPKTVYRNKNQSPNTRMAAVAIIRENLFKASDYKKRLESHKQDPEEKDAPDYDIKLDALKDVLDSNLIVQSHAHRADDIFTALRIGREFSLKTVLVHCTEGHLIGKYIKDSDIGVLVGPSLTDRSKPELKNLTFETAGILDNLGVTVAIITDHPVIPQQYLLLSASLAVKAGMDKYKALKAVTVNPARIMGIDDRVGSIAPGKDADIVVFNRHPLDFETKAIMVFLDGVMQFQ